MFQAQITTNALVKGQFGLNELTVHKPELFHTGPFETQNCKKHFACAKRSNKKVNLFEVGSNKTLNTSQHRLLLNLARICCRSRSRRSLVCRLVGSLATGPFFEA